MKNMQCKMQNAKDLRFSFFIACFAFFIQSIATILCRLVAGVSLGLFFGGVAFATLLVPPLTAGETSIGKRILISALVAIGTAAVWLTALGERLTFAQWLVCSVALLAYSAALAGVCALLLALRFHPAIAAATVTVLGLLWLTWPVWLSPVLRGPNGDAMVAWLVPAHPLAAINAVLVHFDTWDRYPLAYSRLTILNQDVFYTLPRGIAWTVIAHGLLSAATFSAAHWMHARPSVPPPGPAAPTAAT
jgi:hypothetical protein